MASHGFFLLLLLLNVIGLARDATNAEGRTVTSQFLEALCIAPQNPEVTIQPAQLKKSCHGLMQADKEMLQRELTGLHEYFFSAWLQECDLRTSQHRTITYQESNTVLLHSIGFSGN